MLQALAIKYRPKTFDELIGQDTVSTSLKFALDNDRLAHAYLFSGLRGSGKTSSARIFSRALVCEKGPSSNPCGECPQCKSALEGRHIDIIEMDADFSHDPNFVIKFIERMEEEKLDLVIGSRYCNGISVVNWPLRRLFLSYYGTLSGKGGTPLLYSSCHDETALLRSGKTF